MLKRAWHVEEVVSEGAQKEHSLEARMPRVKSQPCHFLGDFGQFPKGNFSLPSALRCKMGASNTVCPTESAQG